MHFKLAAQISFFTLHDPRFYHDFKAEHTQRKYQTFCEAIGGYRL